MPWRVCSIAHCPTLIQRPARYCAAHEPQRREARADRDQRYDRNRDPAAVTFYHSARWKRARADVLAAEPTCRRCGRWAEHVHHVIALKDCTPEQEIDPDNLIPLCQPCHTAEEAEIAAAKGDA